jgi:hypothetical protein
MTSSTTRCQTAGIAFAFNATPEHSSAGVPGLTKLDVIACTIKFNTKETGNDA